MTKSTPPTSTNKNKLWVVVASLFLLVIIYFGFSFFTGVKTYVGQTYSFNYPKSFHPLNNSDWIEFYILKKDADKAEDCILNSASSPENPCGYGDLLFQILVDTDSKTKLAGDKYLDNQGREWLIAPQLPWTGSRFNMQGVDAVLQQDQKTILISLVSPDYFSGKLPKEFIYEILDSFQIKNPN